MTVEEAIAIIRRKTSIPENGEIFEIIEKAYDMAVEALEKQIPKAPIQNAKNAYDTQALVLAPTAGADLQEQE